MLKTNDDEIQFVSTQKKTKKVQKSIGCYATISTSWEVIQIIRSGEHVESCTKPDKLKQWVFVRFKQIYYELGSSVSTSLKTAGQFPAIRYTLAQPEFNAEQTMTKSTFLVVQLVSAGFEILNVGASGQIETLFEVYQLKHTNFEDKQWVCQGVKRRFRSAIHTKSNVNAVLKFAPHAHNCIPYSNILHKIEKHNLKRGAAEEKKLILQIYTSSISANLKLPVGFQYTEKKFESYLNILSGVLIAALKLLLNGTSRCSPFMRHSYMLFVLQSVKRYNL
ncbi:hypothetical protein T05_14545 [Trichinella murrelli]|uniref:Uncharacterized protein n=1 Tax=Trichinella murrelli TaxID=144512 RepID=A0A0V0T4D8_9BILA|nr:hypothetical protein T05_2221 [Trichinella murrelli]KRX33873.1 hypothetical protein T05_13917 [Trichinella murrelli]KRX33880.1 hypothetical protein T05_14545 [Trichinella murrelli]